MTLVRLQIAVDKNVFMSDFRLTDLAKSLPATVPFVGPETQERMLKRPFLARLGANESVFGPSPKAIEAMAGADHWKYGDPENHDLRHAIADHMGATASNIVVGEGIDGLLGYLVRLFVGAGDAVVTSEGAYPTFNYHVAGFGGVLHKVPYDAKDRENPKALFSQAAKVGAKLVYLANPDNPMGTVWTGDEIKGFLDLLPARSLLVLDEAYLECAPAGTSPGILWDDPRLIRMRTFSKVYGMAGARVGYGIGHPDLITAFNKLRNHFGVTRAAQDGALAALQDHDWLERVQAQIETARLKIGEIAKSNGVQAIPSATNFVAIDCGQDGAFAKRVLEAVNDGGVFVRMPFVAPQNRCIRVSCGTPQDLDHFAKVLPGALAQARSSAFRV